MRDADLAALVARREDEQRDAAKILGAIDVRFLRRVDGELVERSRRRGPRSAPRSARSSPTSCSATIPGSRTACIPIITKRDGWPSTASSRHVTRTSSPTRISTPHRPRTLLAVRARPRRPSGTRRRAPRPQDRRAARAPQPVALDDGNRRRRPRPSRPRSSPACTKRRRRRASAAGLRAAEAFARIDRL